MKRESGKGALEYNSWSLMRDRCNNPNNKNYPRYGGVGIVVDDRWDSFHVFLMDMGERPTPLHTIDRIKSTGNYCKENCKWSTRKEQSRNRKNTQLIKYAGEERPLGEWCELLNIDYNNTNKRLWRGWDITRAFTEPKQKDTINERLP